jgi:hypothetical protein
MTADMSVNKFPNGILVAVNYCHDCGHVFGMFMCGVDQQEQVPDQSGPRLVS